MDKVKTVKDWVKSQDEIQFDIVTRNQSGVISQILRIKDQHFFELEVKYPSLRYDYLVFTEFKEDQICVSFSTYKNGKIKSGGFCTINDIMYETKNGRNYYTNSMLEKTIREMTEAGLEMIFG